MNIDLNNIVIEVPSGSNRVDYENLFLELGFNFNRNWFENTFYSRGDLNYYGVINNWVFNRYSMEEISLYRKMGIPVVINKMEDCAKFRSSYYPREMYVWDFDVVQANKRLVVSYIKNVENPYVANQEGQAVAWKNAMDVDEWERRYKSE